jgi:hypothetical protein
MGYIGPTPEDARREQEHKSEYIKGTLSYPFTDSTMKERRNVLTASLFGVLVAYVGIIPKSLPVFGIDFETNEQENLLIFLTLIVIYFVISFSVRAFSDVAAIILIAKEGGAQKNTARTVKTVKTAFLVRVVIDVVVPILTAVIALVGLCGELTA